MKLKAFFIVFLSYVLFLHAVQASISIVTSHKSHNHKSHKTHKSIPKQIKHLHKKNTIKKQTIKLKNVHLIKRTKKSSAKSRQTHHKTRANKPLVYKPNKVLNKKLISAKQVKSKHRSKTLSYHHKPTKTQRISNVKIKSNATLEYQAMPINLQISNAERNQSEASQRLLKRIDTLLNTIQYTHYQLGGNNFDSRRGIYTLDCSRYVAHLLSDSTPAAFASLKHWSGNSLPQAKDYYLFFDALPYEVSHRFWFHIRNTRHLLPGDLIAYRKSLRNASGHVMVVTGAPQRDARYENVYRVQVSDSAHSGHSNDTRGRHGSGVGMGTLLLKVNPLTGEPYQFAWREGSRWETNNSIAMGRPMG